MIHSEPVGSGYQACQYLAPYIFRVAFSNNRLRKLEQGAVTFSYKESATDQLKHCTITAPEFIRRFLQHVLPPRFIKVRYYGLLSPAHRQRLQQARQLLSATSSKLKPQAVKTLNLASDKSCMRDMLTRVRCMPLLWCAYGANISLTTDNTSAWVCLSTLPSLLTKRVLSTVRI
jgi:putative transposase